MAPVKACPECQAYLPIATWECPHCGYIFPPPEPPKLDKKASSELILSQYAPKWVPVTSVTYHRHVKLGSQDSLCVTYDVGMAFYREWVCLQHTGFAREKAVKWWVRRAPGMAVPSTIHQALKDCHALAEPRQIAVNKVGRYHEIVGAKF